jgi:hypothetical protein
MGKHLLSTALFLGLIFQSFAQMPGWSYTRPITVWEGSGAHITDYQLRMEINTADLVTAGHMLASGDDIRFTSSCTGGTNFPYWIESGMNTVSTVIWVKIDTLQAYTYRTIHLHYGNASAPMVSAIDGTFFGPHSATDSVSGGAAGGVTDSQRGVRFAAAESVLVTSFGKNEPNGTTRYITLFDNATQAVLRQIQVSGPAAQYSYSDLASPIWLNQGQQYVLEMHQNSTDGYYYGPSTSQMGQHLTYLDMRYCNGCDQNTFPTNYLNNIHYGYPDLWYYTKKNVTPAPTYELTSFILGSAVEVDMCLEDSISLPIIIGGGEAPFTFSWTGGPVSDSTVLSPFVSPADTTEYFITATDACGGTRVDSITVNVKPLPFTTIVSSAPLICNGEYAELSVTDSTLSYFWPADSTTAMTSVVMPSVTTTYSVEATNVHGCTDEFFYEQAVNVPFTPVYDVTICANGFHTVGNSVHNLSGTYVDTLAGVTNCDSIVTTNLTVTPLPAATHPVTICYETSYTIGQHTYDTEGTYIDTIAGAGCDSIITTILTIQEDIDAQIQAIGFTLVADVGADAYMWVDCNNGNTVIPGATGPVFEATANGSYAAMLTVGNCTKISNCIGIATIGLDEYDIPDNVSVFPNPNNGTFTVQSSVSQVIRIIDALGQQVATVDVIAGQPQPVDLKNLEAGIYFLESRTKVIRLVLE